MDSLNRKPKEKKQKTWVLIILGVMLFIFLKSIFNTPSKKEIQEVDNQNSLKEESLTSPQETKKDLSISKEKFDFYNKAYLKFHSLQDKYEKEYLQFGKVSFEEAKNIPEDAEFPKYGAITREITSIYQDLPKLNTNMSPGEEYLLSKVANYGSSLIFMTPEKEGIEGMNYVTESREILENALKETEDFNNF